MTDNHLLPFKKIILYHLWATIYSSSGIRKATQRECVIRITDFDLEQCSYCKKGRMVVVEEIPRIRSPSENLNTLLQKLLY